MAKACPEADITIIVIGGYAVSLNWRVCCQVKCLCKVWAKYIPAGAAQSNYEQAHEQA